MRIRNPFIMSIEGGDADDGGGDNRDLAQVVLDKAGHEFGDTTDTGDDVGRREAKSEDTKVEDKSSQEWKGELESLKKSHSDELGDLKQQIQFLTGQLINNREERREDTSKVEKSKPKLPSKEEFLAKAADDPGGAIAEIVQQVLQHTLPDFKENLTKEVDSKDSNRRQLESRMVRARQQVQEDFGDFLDDPEFKKDAERAFKQMVEEDGGLAVDHFYNAAARTANRWRRDGKAPKSERRQENRNGDNSGRSIRDIVRDVPKESFRSSSGGGGDRGGQPQSLRELFGNDSEADAAKRIMRQMGLPAGPEGEKIYIRNIMAARRANPDFGGRLNGVGREDRE